MVWRSEDSDISLDAVIDPALQEGPQRVIRRDGTIVMVIARPTESVDDTAVMTLKDLILHGPSLEGLDLERDRAMSRDTGL